MICISTHLLITPPLGGILCPARKWGDTLGLDHQEEFQQCELGHVHGLHEQPVDKPASEQTGLRQVLHLFAPRQQTQPSMWASTQTDLPRQCKNIHGLRLNQIRRTKQHSCRESRSVIASTCRRAADETTPTSAVKAPSRFS
jgi:hypothetical protein